MRKKETFFVIGVPVWHLVHRYRDRMRRKVLMLSLPTQHSAQIIDLAEWKASRQMPN